MTNLRPGSTSDIDLLIEIDTDASVLFEHAGLHLDVAADREVTLAARERWLRCLRADTVLVATGSSGYEVGFAAVGERDGQPFLDQLSVRRDAMRQGIGTALLDASLQPAQRTGGAELWLTTYDHMSWNRPFYERHGFAMVATHQCGSELQRELAFERRLLPDPEHRIAMKRLVGSLARRN
jgi:GNAT superfamily N-acetyltransferase